MEGKSRSQRMQPLGMRAIYSLVFCASAFLFSSPALGVPSLNEQLDIRINNDTQGELRDEADRLVFLGGEQQYRGNLEEAIPYWFKAAEIYHQIGDFEALGQTYDFIGLAYVQLGLYKEAEAALRRRLAVARTNMDLQGQIYGLNNVGTVLLKRQSLPAAKASFEEALAIARTVKNPGGEGLSLSNLGLEAAGRRDYNRAIALYEEALIYRRRANDKIGEANTYNNLGDAYLANNNYRGSVETYGAALRIGEEKRDPGIQYRAIDGLVKAHSSVGRYPRVLELLQKRLAIAKATENRHQEIKSLLLLGDFYYHQGKYLDALMAYHQAIALDP